MDVTGTMRVVLATVMSVAAFAPTALAGEPKNEAPFTRTIAPKSQPLEVAGEQKNELPFTQPVPDVNPVVVRGGDGFDWTDGGIGVAAGIGIALAGAGAMVLVRKSPRTA